MRRAPGSLLPANDDALRLLERIEPGELVTIRVEQPRSLRELRFYWAMVQWFGDGIGITKQQVHDELRRHLGYYTTRRDRDGKEWHELASMSFADRPQPEFHDYVVAARETIAAYLGMSVEHLSDEVCREKGVPPMDVDRSEDAA